MLKRTLIPALTFILIFSCSKQSQGIKQKDMRPLINIFLNDHVQYHSIDDKISVRILKNYINSLDYGKYYFYKSDIKSLNVHSDKIDDYIAAGKYEIIFKVYDIYKKRYKESQVLSETLLKGKFNFNKDEKVIIDREKVPFARNKKEMQDRWRKNIKLQLINYMSAGKNLAEAKKKLRKKYELTAKRISEIDRDKLYSRFLNAVSMALDPHSNYLSQSENEDFKIAIQLKLEGIGVRLRSEDGFVIVQSVIAGGATSKLSKDIILKPEDKIIGVAQKDGEPVDVIDMDLRDVVKMIRGKKGTEVRLTILRRIEGTPKPKRMIVPIVREEIKLKDSDAESDITTIKLGGTSLKIGYIRLPSFYMDSTGTKSSAVDIEKFIKDLNKKGARGIILDLRGNPGGMLNEAKKIAGHFIDSGPILQIKDGHSPAHVMYDDDSGILFQGPLIVLIDRFSASASEIIAGAIKDYKRGIVIGPSPTFGKGTVQSYKELPQKMGAIKVTTHIFYQPGGTSNQLNGISPDIRIPSLSSVWDIGEDKTRYPLKWKPIQKAYFNAYNLVNNSLINVLKIKSKRRIKNSSEFNKLIKSISRMKKQLRNKAISLKEESDLEKKRTEELKKAMEKKENDKVIDLKKDLFLKEAFNIMHDYIRLIPRTKGAK